jgi:hypothetical protein
LALSLRLKIVNKRAPSEELALQKKDFIYA